MCNLCAGKIRNLGALFKVVRNAIGISSLLFPNLLQSSVSTVSKRLLETPSGNSPCRTRNLPESLRDLKPPNSRLLESNLNIEIFQLERNSISCVCSLFVGVWVFQNRGFAGKRFLSSLLLPFLALLLRSPQFSRGQKAKNASNVRKTLGLRKRLLRRLGFR